MTTLTCLRTTLAASLFAVLPLPSASAQDSIPTGPRSERTKRPRPPKLELSISLTGEYDNNVFLLSDGRKDDLGTRSSADEQSGRFDAMENAADGIARLGVGIALETRGFGGRDLIFEPEVDYEYYLRNSERRNVVTSFGLTQDLPRSSRFKLGAAYTPDYFAKNYLADAVDRNSDGIIARDERIYAAGRYSDLELKAAYRFRLRKSARRSPLGMHLEPSVGYYTRSYDAPFEGRDRAGPRAGIALDFDAGRTELAVGYLFEALSADATPAVLILNEPDVGRDLNGNGNTTDTSLRTVQRVDRSRNEHSMGATLKLNPPGRMDLLIEYEHRLRDFSSVEELDVAHLGRRDRRNEIRGEIGSRLVGRVRWVNGLRYAKQTTNRAGDLGGLDEIDDYSRIRAYSGLMIRF